MNKADKTKLVAGAVLLAGLAVSLSLIGQRNMEAHRLAKATAQASAPVAAKESQQPKPQAPAYTTRDLTLANMADAAADKRRSVLYVSRNAPRITLYDTKATHAACTINGKPMQVAEVGDGEFTCYRWIGDAVALRVEGDRFVTVSGSNFRAK